jgi:hypothetical protein
MAGKKLVIFDDIPKSKNKEAHVNETKNIQTARMLRSEKKYQDEVYLKNFVQTFNLSNNYKTMVPISNATDAARRFWGLLCFLTPWVESPYVKEVLGFENKEQYWKWYYKKLYENDYEAIKTFANLLYHAPIEIFDPRHPKTSRLVLENKISNMSEVTQWWVNSLRRKANNDDGTWTTVQLTQENGVTEEQGTCTLGVLYYSFYNTGSKMTREDFDSQLREILPPSVKREQKTEMDSDPNDPKKRRKKTVISYSFGTWSACVDYLEIKIPGIKRFITSDDWGNTVRLFIKVNSVGEESFRTHQRHGALRHSQYLYSKELVQRLQVRR